MSDKKVYNCLHVIVNDSFKIALKHLFIISVKQIYVHEIDHISWEVRNLKGQCGKSYYYKLAWAGYKNVDSSWLFGQS